MPNSENRAIYILSFKKWGFIIHLAALKKGAIGTHIRTMSYISEPPPPPPELQTIRNKLVIRT